MDIALLASPKKHSAATLSSNIYPVKLTIDYLLKFLLLLVLITVFVPFSPKLPGPSLDASWALALNQAIAQGLAFGKDIVFTLGPYSSVYTKSYHPATDWMMLWGSLYLSFCYWLCLIRLTKGVQWRWTIALGMVLFCMMYSRDSLFFSYPLLLGIFIYITRFLNESFEDNPLLFALLLSPLGLLSLVKGSLLILAIGSCLFFGTFLRLHHQSRCALLSFVVPCFSLLFFWILCGQSIANIPTYVYSTLVLSSGFTESMSLIGNKQEIVLYWLVASLILVSFFLDKNTAPKHKIFLSTLYLFFLFISSKAGFTRHFGHAFIGGTSILLAAFLLPFVTYSKWNIPIIAVAIYASTYINGQYTNISIQDNIVSTYKAAWYGAKFRIENKNWLKQNYDLALNFLKEQDGLPTLPGNTDIYSYHQSSLIAAGMKWSPRPIFQSYSVFTPSLAYENAHYLAGATSPDHIIFKIEPIDDRLPSLEDGSSWPMLLSNYQPFLFKNDNLYLRKQIKSPALRLHKVSEQQAELEERIKIPKTSHPLFVEFEIQPTVWGSIMNTLFKSDQLQIDLRLMDGKNKPFRLIANMAGSMLLLSPLIENTSEFGLLFNQDSYLDKKIIESFSIKAQRSYTKHWKQHYKVRFYELL